jgi:hypothetical protein
MSSKLPFSVSYTVTNKAAEAQGQGIATEAVIEPVQVRSWAACCREITIYRELRRPGESSEMRIENKENCLLLRGLC